MRTNLAFIADSMLDQISKKAKKLKPSQILKALDDINPRGIPEYKSDLQAGLAVISSEALDQARKEVPKAKSIKLMENEERLLFGEFERLPSGIRRRIKFANNLLIGTQIADLQKVIAFQFSQSSAAETGAGIASIVAEELVEVTVVNKIVKSAKDKAEEYINGNSVAGAAGVTAPNTVNEARNAFFFDKETLKQVEAFQFLNLDPVTAICTDLNGTIFAKDDPNAFKFTPPLHYNCDSWIRPILRLKPGQEIQKFEPSTKAIEDTIQFCEIIGTSMINFSDTQCHCS